MRNRIVAGMAVVAICILSTSCSDATTSSDQSSVRSSTPPSESVPHRSATPLVIALDVSGSMNTDDMSGTRIHAAREAVHDLAASLDDKARVGLVRIGGARADNDPAACSDVATVTSTRSLNRGDLDATLATLTPTGRTPTGLALQEAARQLPMDAAAEIVIVSDGEANCAPYPCDVARQLHSSKPNLVISAIALHASASTFRCLTAPSGGVSVGADSARQLARRLTALSDIGTARELLAPTGAQGIAIGESYGRIRMRFGDFPATTLSTASGDVTVITWRNCKWVFDSSGVLTQVRTESGGTIDGVAVGENIARAEAEYGSATSSASTEGSEAGIGDRVSTFSADTSAGTNWRIITGGGAIRRITLCRCSTGSSKRVVTGFPDIAELQSLPAAGSDGLFGRWWIRGSTLVVDRSSGRVFVWSSDTRGENVIEAIARIDRIDGAGGAATVVDSNADVGPYVIGSDFAFSSNLLPQGTLLSVHFARQVSRNWCGQTSIPDCFE